ncbi:peptidoglycan-binding protein [Streptomyces liliifuscus]|uniref:Peptidoglycan-binding protein n=1 Tax=Streptomyces liliifuscus TaxID=2797636 RepID=A0A7T7HZN0_9ACTN|nr:peptidoglycan-binding protein [Streptomyces liliifuscus]QQM38280.1 peptidoglycan-binding protein [Streptomyces liliifuscus]
MSRWKELPAELHVDVRQFIVRLRRLKDRSELSTRQLAAKSGYSVRSWQRYLNGRSLPPPEAVEAMARIGGDDPTRLLVLHEIAAEQWAEGRVVTTGAPQSTPAHTPTEQQPYGRYPRALITAGAVALVLSVSAALLLAVRLADTRAQLADARAAAVPAAPAAPTIVSESLVPVIYTCRLDQRNGRWYAGLSRTTDAILAYTYVGPEVAEAQCLLRRAGMAPGDIDGVFGPKTQRAVERIQTRDGLVVDGVIGPHTWKALREAVPK